jgi:hypothetical protein
MAGDGDPRHRLATTQVVVATGSPAAGRRLTTWPAATDTRDAAATIGRFRRAEHLAPGLRHHRRDGRGVHGPVGIATAAAARILGLPLIGISTGRPAAGLAADGVRSFSAGLSDDRRAGQPPELLWPAGAGTGRGALGVDLDGRRSCPERGDRSRARARAHRAWAARLWAGDVDDLAGLVPEYVTLPRGVRAEGGEVSWSRDHR